MRSVRTCLPAVAVLVCCLSVFGQSQQRPVIANNPMEVDVAEYLNQIQLPDGFRIDFFAPEVEGARSMTLSPSGVLYVGTFRQRRYIPGKVYAILDDNKDGIADRTLTIASNLNMPNGVAFHDGHLYVAEINRILRFENIESDIENVPEPTVINDSYPTDTFHGWKFIRFGPDGRLYVPVGAPCNACEPDKRIYASLTRLNPDGSKLEIYARGIRNTVGFDWHPQTGELWFTENGRDLWGDDRPPEELNHAPEAGLHFGFPYRYGKALVDTAFSTELNESRFQPAAIEMPAHTAVLGMRFYTGKSFPGRYMNQIFLAEHGSWNRSIPDGYRVSVVLIEGTKAVSYEHFATGWLIGEKYWGRPVDVEVMADGSLLVSDDFANCIYRIWYEG